MKILFIGCVKSSEVFLRELIELKAEIVGVVTKKESMENADFVDLSEICRINEISFYYCQNVNGNACEEYIRTRNPDIIFCFGWSQLLKKNILSIPPNGCIGFHPASLPKNRGRHPLIWALALGLKETASSFFLLSETADEGAIVSQKKIVIEYEDDADILYNKVLKAAVKQLKQIMEQLDNEELQLIFQDERESNCWRKRNKEDGKIDWRMSSYSIYNLVRALARPYVGAHFEHNGIDYKVWKVCEVKDENYENIEPGKIVQVYEDGTFIVKTGMNLIKVLERDNIFERSAGRNSNSGGITTS